MKILTIKKLFGNGTISEYSKVISGNKKTNYTPPAPGSVEEKYEKYRQKVKNSRLRAATRSMSFDFYFHNVFTTTNKKISHDPELFIQLVISILKKQNINYFLVLELNHPRNVWQYDWEEEDKNNGIENDEIINRYGCYNRIVLAPLSEDEGFHIHVLTDRKVNFTEWIENYGGNPKNLYSELFLYEQIDNVKYILKYFYYTKSVLPDNFHIYRSNIKRIKHGIVISEKDLDTGITNVLYSSEKMKEIKEERRLQRKYYSNLNHNLCNLNTNFFKYIKENYNFWNVLNRQNVLLFSIYHFNHFVNNIHINTNVFQKCCSISFSFFNLLPHKKVTSSDILYFDFGSIINKKETGIKKAYLKSSKSQTNDKYNKIDTNKIGYKKKLSSDLVLNSRNFNIKLKKTGFEKAEFKNWLLKYVIFIKTIP